MSDVHLDLDDELRDVERRWRLARQAFVEADRELDRAQEQLRIARMTPAERRAQLRVVAS